MIPNLITEDQLLTPGSEKLFNEKIVTRDSKQYRMWNPYQSKLAAAIKKGVKVPDIKSNARILYLGAAHGYTVSYLSDCLPEGKLFAVEFSPTVAQDLVFNLGRRENVLPIIGDAQHPEEYFSTVLMADVIIQDIAQKNQAQIFLRNMNVFGSKDTIGILVVKAKSIDVSSKTKAIYQRVKKELDDEVQIIDSKPLGPFERDHAIFVCRKK